MDSFLLARLRVAGQTGRMGKFNVGDVVFLNSGSPKMTVTTVLERTVQVEWWNGLAMNSAEFPVACLTYVAQSVQPQELANV